MCCCRVLLLPRHSQFSQAAAHGTSSPWPSAHPTPLLSAFDETSDSLDHTPKATGETELQRWTRNNQKLFLSPLFPVFPELHKLLLDHADPVTSLPTLQDSLGTAGNPVTPTVHLPLSLLHLQIGTHGVQKTHRHRLHPLPPLHHPKSKLCLLESTLASVTGSESCFPAGRILTPSLWERLSPGSSSSHSSSLSTS